VARLIYSIVILAACATTLTAQQTPDNLRPGSMEWTQWWVQHHRVGDGPYWAQVPQQRAEWDAKHGFDSSATAEQDALNTYLTDGNPVVTSPRRYVAYEVQRQLQQQQAIHKSERSGFWVLVMVSFGATALVVGLKHHHRWWTSFLAGLFLGPVGVVLAMTSLTMKPVTKPAAKPRDEILSADVVTNKIVTSQTVSWPQYRPDPNEPYSFG
jgi:hypothetical protein